MLGIAQATIGDSPVCAIGTTDINVLLQAVLLLEVQPLRLEPDEGVGVPTQEKRVGLSLEADGRARANAVVVAGPHGRGIGNSVEHALEAGPLGAGIGLASCAANLSHEQ